MSEQTEPTKRRKGISGLAIPAGILIGIGVGYAVGNFLAGLFIGLGLGFLTTMILRLKFGIG